MHITDIDGIAIIENHRTVDRSAEMLDAQFFVCGIEHPPLRVALHFFNSPRVDIENDKQYHIRANVSPA